MLKTKVSLLGAHLSIAGGFYKAILKGEEIGCTAIAVFTKSNRQWDAKPLTEESIALFKETQAGSPVQMVVSHAGYLINLGAASQQAYKKSINSLQQELERCEQLGIPYLVFHPGTFGTSLNTSLEQVSYAINLILEAIPGHSMFAIETMSGQGNSMCATLEQLAFIYSKIKHKTRVGFCVDTCHIFAAGYDIRTSRGYHAFFEKFDYLLGLDKLKVFHLNDSKKPLDSKLDRHEFIGKGAIGLEFFELLMNDKRFISVPKILEVPIDDNNYHQYEPDLLLLKSLMS